jgi:uncharacterized protein (DUF4415 family)
VVPVRFDLERTGNLSVMMLRSGLESQRENEIVMCRNQHHGDSRAEENPMADDRRRPLTMRDAAEAAFKKATTKPADLPPPKPAIPIARETVSLRLDRDILDHFQAGGPGWQDRINDALRKLIGK